MVNFVVLIAAAGFGRRLGHTTQPKQYTNIGNKTLLAHTIECICALFSVCKIKIVIHKSHASLYDNTISSLSSASANVLLPTTFGGLRRQDSVRLGLLSIKSLAPDYVIIHDACRPFIPDFPMQNCIQLLEESSGVVPTIAPVDTVCFVRDHAIHQHIPKESIMMVQTPQIFRYKDLLTCHEDVFDRSPEEHFPDDSSLMVSCGLPVAAIDGHNANFKITTKEDLERAISILHTTSNSGPA